MFFFDSSYTFANVSLHCLFNFASVTRFIAFLQNEISVSSSKSSFMDRLISCSRSVNSSSEPDKSTDSIISLSISVSLSSSSSPNSVSVKR